MGGAKETRIRVTEDGPYKVSGADLLAMRPVKNHAGRPVGWRRGRSIDHDEPYALCRCGRSSNKPFCDGAHAATSFDGTETAERETAGMRRRNFNGRGLVMTDVKKFCVHAGFCVSEKTEAWDLVRKTTDPAARDKLIGMIRNCPSGRLEYAEPPVDAPVEEPLPREIGIVQNGPLYVRGRIVVEGADGRAYEVRNRMTLCRCGASKNKPFCDGSHAEIGFRD
ncbi:MAG TPA: CDGSH iron-sulfur domain-containing protein [Nitrospiria bacterium]|jgi:CDGSH-type Zn-finger protein|nr:CDGSH iron-sulfur domain-containing protein [Nitrospiria bacterium]